MECIGVDMFIVYDGIPAMPKKVGAFELELISNRGQKIPEEGDPGFMLVDWHRCRYRAERAVEESEVIGLVSEIGKSFHWEKAQKLYRKDGKDLFSKAQGA